MDSSGNRSSCNGNNDSRDSKAFEEINTSNDISNVKNKNEDKNVKGICKTANIKGGD